MLWQKRFVAGRHCCSFTSTHIYTHFLVIACSTSSLNIFMCISYPSIHPHTHMSLLINHKIMKSNLIHHVAINNTLIVTLKRAYVPLSTYGESLWFTGVIWLKEMSWAYYVLNWECSRINHFRGVGTDVLDILYFCDVYRVSIMWMEYSICGVIYGWASFRSLNGGNEGIF